MQHCNLRTFMQIFIVFICLKCVHCAPNKSQTRALSDTALVDDIKWFFRGVGDFAATVERMMPNVNVDTKNNTFSENARLTLLMGLRHVLVGVREISMTFEQSFKTDHIKHLQQFKNATNFVTDLISAMKIWFSQLRALALHLYTLYNRYIPEVLFGRCLGNYLVSAYPDRSYYEYPVILLWEMYASVVPTTETSSSPEDVDSTTIKNNKGDDLNMAQNEIPQADTEEYVVSGYVSSKYPRHAVAIEDESSSESSPSESIFNLSSVLNDNKDKVIEYAVQQQSWRICLKLYTAESISRSLRSYFLNL